MPRQLGRLPHDPNRPVLHLSRYLTGAVPDHPPSVDYFTRVHDWTLGANDVFGTCGPTAVANQRAQVSLYLGGQEALPTQDDIFELYKTQNPDFDPLSGTGDNGVVLADMLSALLRDGIGGIKPLAYAAVDPDSFDEVHAAIALFGSVIFGVDLDVAQDDQTEHGQVWDYVRRSKDWGGHCVLAGAYTGQTGKGQADVEVITWAQPQGCTDEFCARQLAEAWVVIWPEMLGTTEFCDGVNLELLAADYQSLTGRPFPTVEPDPTPDPDPTGPMPVVPPPSPSPRPNPGDEAFRAALGQFVSAAQEWLAP